MSSQKATLLYTIFPRKVNLKCCRMITYCFTLLRLYKKICPSPFLAAPPQSHHPGAEPDLWIRTESNAEWANCTASAAALTGNHSIHARLVCFFMHAHHTHFRVCTGKSRLQLNAGVYTEGHSLDCLIKMSIGACYNRAPPQLYLYFSSSSLHWLTLSPFCFLF